MGTQLELTASDGHRFGAYRADPAGAPAGAVVVIQEIFGVNSHIRSVCDRVAELGYVAVAPALFDRHQRDFQSGYSEGEVQRARAFLGDVDWEAMLRDVEAAVDSVRAVGPVAVIGFCMGGSLAFLAAARLEGLSAAIGYYGGKVAAYADEPPRCPTQLHFGAEDQGIPLSDVETVRARRPDCEIHVYEAAGHGFHCDERASYHPEAAAKAWGRSTDWLRDHMARCRVGNSHAGAALGPAAARHRPSQACRDPCPGDGRRGPRGHARGRRRVAARVLAGRRGGGPAAGDPHQRSELRAAGRRRRPAGRRPLCGRSVRSACRPCWPSGGRRC